MSVNVEDRTESKVEYLEVARQISKRTAQIVSNGPKKYLRLDAHRTVAEMEAYRQRLLEDAGLA